jgi:flavodoxin
MNICVIYASLTGHSRKIAEAVAESLNVSAKNIRQKPEIKDVDLLFIAGGIYADKCNKKLLDFVKTLNNGNVRNAALITSCASGNARQNAVREILRANGVNVLEDEYICKGSFLFMVKGHPSDEEIKGAADFAVKIAEKFKP